MAEFKLKKYMFSFVEGGFNFVWAKTLKGAKNKALEVYKYDNNLNVRLNSVHLATKEGELNAMSLFY